MPTIRENFMELEGSIQEVFDAYTKKKVDYIPMLYNVQKSTRSQENHLGTGALGQMVEWNGTVNFDDFSKGYEQNYRHIKYSNGLQVEREVMDFKEYKEVARRTDKLAYSVYKTLQTHGASTFNKAFDTTVLGPDGVSLCNAAHHQVPEDDAQNNTGVLDLSVDNLETVMNAMYDFKDDRGDIMGVMPKLIICGNYWLKTAKQIVGSDREPYVADNQINTYKDEVNYLHIPYITGKKWFVVDPDLMKMYLNWYNARDPKKVEYTDDFDTEVGKYKSVGMWSKGWDSAFFLYGNNPA